MISVSFSATRPTVKERDAALNRLRPKSVETRVIVNALKAQAGTYDRQMNRIIREYKAARRANKSVK